MNLKDFKLASSSEIVKAKTLPSGVSGGSVGAGILTFSPAGIHPTIVYKILNDSFYLPNGDASEKSTWEWVFKTEKGLRWFEVYTHGGRKSTNYDALQWAIRAVKLGAGELLVTSMDKDGTENGYDLELTREISERVTVPVIASGGAGRPNHFLEAFTRGKADAALAASVFHFNKYPLPIVKQFLYSKGVPVRI